MKTHRIDQAIFTTSDSDATGYRVVAASPGVSSGDLDELATWGPTRNSLLADGPDAVSLSFHPLPSGNYCVARTTPMLERGAPPEHMRMYTQNLIVTPVEFHAFGNHPLRLFETALSSGAFRWEEEIPHSLPTLALNASSTTSDEVYLGRLMRQPGPTWMAVLLQTVLDNVTTAIVGGPPAVHVIAGLLSCLPVDCRPEMSFSTGLRFSARRPFRVIGLHGNDEEFHRIERLYNVSVADLSRRAPEVNDLFEAWPQLVYRALRAGETAFLARRAAQSHPEISLRDLSVLGLELLEEFDRSVLTRGTREEEEAESRNWAEALSFYADLPEAEMDDPSAADLDGSEPEVDVEAIAEFLDMSPEEWDRSDDAPDAREQRRPHAPHKPMVGSLSYLNAGADVLELAPSRTLRERHPALAADLEVLDRTVYDTLAGRPDASARLSGVWLALREELDDDVRRLVAEQYLRYTLTLMSGPFDPAAPRQPDVTVRALDVFQLLSPETE